ncbi:MAG: pyridoxal phosphate-dependent aminotransferase [Lentisphaerae bacterium]|nr:pyridoxal phosphate-dependent aminotransferase [Lentisphaerota bacterium]
MLSDADLRRTCGPLGSLTISETLSILEQAEAWERQGRDVCMMSVGEPDFDTPDFIKEACIRALREGRTTYTAPDGIHELRAAIIDKFAAVGISAGLDQVVVSPGGKFACAAAIGALCGPGDEVIIPTPYWVSHVQMVRAAGAKCVLVPTSAADNFELTAESLAAAISDRTRLLILCTPSNPTGTVYRRAALEMIAEAALRHNFMVLSDEVYEKLTYDAGQPHLSIAALSPEIAEHSITVNSFSKSYAMTGWRVGYSCAPSWLSRKISNLQCHFVANVTTFAQYGALAALQHGEKACQEMRESFARRRDLICGLLPQVPGTSFIRPSGAFYVLLDISSFGLSSAEFCQRLVAEARVAAAPGAGFGAEGFIRLSYACSQECICKAVQRLAEFTSTLR